MTIDPNGCGAPASAGHIDASARDRWRELDEKLRPFIARRVRSEVDVDDVLQDVFVKMQRGLGTLRDEERFGPWVYRVARSAIVDHHRAATRHPIADPARAPGAEALPTTLADDHDDHDDHDDDHGELSAKALLVSALPPFVAMLPSPYREALTLVELQGLTQREAADMLGVSLSGMKSRVQRGRALLRNSLEDCCHIALDSRGKPMSIEVREDGHLPSRCCE